MVVNADGGSNDIRQMDFEIFCLSQRTVGQTQTTTNNLLKTKLGIILHYLITAQLDRINQSPAIDSAFY